MRSHKPPRPAQVLRMRKVRARSSNMPSSREGLSPSPRTGARLGPQSSPTLAYYVNTPLSSKVLQMVSISESRQYAAPMPQRITTLSSASSCHITTSWSMSSQPAGISVPSHASKWRPTWALFKHPLYPSSPKHPNRASSKPCTTSPTRTTPCLKQLQSTHRSMATTSRALGVPSPLSPSLSPTSPQTLKPPCVTSPRRTGPSPSPPPNGQDLSSACNQKTNLPSTCAITSASPRPEVYTDLWQMLGQIYSGEMALACWRSGSMTTFSSGYPGYTYPNITHAGQTGAKKSAHMGAAGRTAAASGTEAKTCRMVPQRSSMRIAAPRSMTWQMPLPVPRKTKFSPTPKQTSTRYRSASEFGGRCRNRSPLGRKSLTSAFAGIYAHALYTCSRRKKRSTWLQSQNGNLSARTTSSKRRNYMANSSTLLWSCQQDALISPAWKPCWAPSITVYSYRTPHPVTRQVTLNGGSSNSTNPRSPGPSLSPNPSSITMLTPTQAPFLGWQSQIGRSGARGDLRPAGSPKGGTSNAHNDLP